MKKILNSLIITCFLGVSMMSVLAQEPTDSSGRTYLVPPPLDVSVSTGMSYSSAFGSSYFVAPSFSKQITPKFRLNFGMQYTRFNLKPLVFSVNPPDGSREASSVRVWTEGVYALNDKWFITAYMMKDVGGSRLYRDSPFYIPTEAYGVAVDYIPSDRVRFRAEFNYTRGSGGWGNYPYGPSNYNRFGDSGFGIWDSGFGIWDSGFGVRDLGM